MNNKVSVIIRTKNSERWIAACLEKVYSQTVTNMEAVIVDNKSTDLTLARARSVDPDIKIITIDEYYPGKALNVGITHSSGDYIVCLSSHCIPKDDHWLENLLKNFEESPPPAGVYGRQLPMNFSGDFDKRDLLITFGLDKKIQKKDPFFHNANSMIPRKIWEDYPFDEEISNIEDRLWAQQVLSDGHYIVYEPDAAVYHYHGIHQNRDEKRARNVVRIMESDIDIDENEESNPFSVSKINIPILIPVRDDAGIETDLQKRLMNQTIISALESNYASGVYVSTDSPILKKEAEKAGARVLYDRPSELAEETVPLIDVIKDFLKWNEEKNIFFDYIITMETTHPFRPKGVVDKCIKYTLDKGFENVIAGALEYRPCWWLEGDTYRRIDDYLKKRNTRDPIQIGLPALCSVISPPLIRSGRRIGDKVGIVEFDSPISLIEVRSNNDYQRLKPVFDFMSKINNEQ